MANTESYERLSTILNSLGDAVIATDLRGLITFMNPVAETLTGWEMEEVSGKPVTDILDIYVGNAGNLKKSTFLIEAFQKGSVATGELLSASEADHTTYLIAKSGREIPIDCNIRLIKDEKENRTGIAITFRDITKYKTMEEQSNQTISELRQQTQLMKTVFDSMYDGIVVLSLTGDILFLNPSIQQMFGQIPPETLISKWSEVYGVFYPDKETRVQSGHQKFPILYSDKTTMTISGRHIQEGAHLIVDGRRVPGTLISQQGVFSDMDIIVELETLPMDGMHFLQIQNPDGMFSNDFIFHVAHEKTDDTSSTSSQKSKNNTNFLRQFLKRLQTTPE